MNKFCFVFVLISLALCLSAEVKNPDKPLKGRWDFQIQKIWEIEKAGDEVLGRPAGLVVSDENNLYVHDNGNKINYIFNQEGVFLKAFAKRGQGPGELPWQGHSFFVDGKLIISGPGSLHYFSKEGKFIKSLKSESFHHIPRLFLNEDEFISAPETFIHMPEGRAWITRVNIKTKEEARIADFSVFKGGVGQSGGETADVISIGLSPLMTVGCRNERIYFGMSDTYKINVCDLEGKKLNSFSVKRKPKKVSKKMKQRLFSSWRNVSDEMRSKIINSFPDRATFFYRIEIHEGLVYVFVPGFDFDRGISQIEQIDVFSPEGKYLYKTNIDFGENNKPLFSPFHNFILKKGYLYAALETEDDRVVISKYRVLEPGL